MVNTWLRLPLLLASLLAGSLNVAEATSAFTLAGSVNSATGITVDDNLDVYLNGGVIYSDGVVGAGTRPPITFMGNTGDTLRFVVRDTFGVCSSLSPVYLFNATGQGVLADAGFNLGCGRPNTDQGVTHDLNFTIPDFALQPGDIVTGVYSASRGLVVRLNPTSGMRAIASDF